MPPLAEFEVEGAEAPVEEHLWGSPREDFAGSAPVTVSLVSAGRELKRGSVNVHVRREGRVLVASRSLPVGHVIAAGDLVEQAVDRPAADAIRDRSLLIGRQTARSIGRGTVWRETLVKDAPQVTRGELVRIRLHSGALRIDGIARARQDGAAGDRVRVLNVESRRELVGTVTEDGVVHVAF